MSDQLVSHFKSEDAEKIHRFWISTFKQKVCLKLLRYHQISLMDIKVSRLC